MKVFYFIKYFEIGFTTYFEKITKSKATFTFDLEDSILDFNDSNMSRIVKERYRMILLNILNQNLNLSFDNSIAIRINNPSTEEFIKDIKLLNDLKEVQWETIIIPKIENVNQIKFTLHELNNNHIKFQNIAIFIETKEGMSSLKDIISNNIPELKYVIFGHADFNLDNEIFPFIHQTEKQYWNWVEKIYNELNESDIIFINSPCLFLNDDTIFTFNLNMLSSLFEKEYGQMTLTLGQTLMCNNFMEEELSPLNYPIKKCIDKVEFAIEMLKEASLKKSDKSFSINGDNYLICPQEKVMARIFLDS